MPRQLDGERRNSLPTHLSESESERAVGMWMQGGRAAKGLEGERVRLSVKAKGKQQNFPFKHATLLSLVRHIPCVLNLKKYPCQISL